MGRALLAAWLILLIIESAAWAKVVHVSACDPASIRAAVLSVSGFPGGEVKIDNCTDINGPIDLTGIAGVDIDFGMAQIHADGHPVGLDLTGSSQVKIHHVHVFNATKADILAALDGEHCSKREQGNHVFDDVNADSQNVAGSRAVVFEGSEQNTIMNSPWNMGNYDSLDVWGHNAGPVPVMSPFSKKGTCPIGQTNLQGTVIQSTFGSFNGSIPIRFHGDIDSWVFLNLYTPTAGNPPGASTPGIDFGNYNTFNIFVHWRNEATKTAVRGNCRNCVFMVNDAAVWPTEQPLYFGFVNLGAHGEVVAPKATITPSSSPTLSEAPVPSCYWGFRYVPNKKACCLIDGYICVSPE
jgi:hypothetical protein